MNSMLGKLLFALCLALLAAAVRAQAPGEYITNQGWGRLVIRKVDDVVSRFELRSSGANGHECALEGDIRSGVASLSAVGGEAWCKVGFSDFSRGIVVTPQEPAACRQFCGARAGFDGKYLAVATACRDSARRKAEDEALASYRGARYERAERGWSTLLDGCSDTLSAIEAATVRNDLALAYFHSNQREKCLETLKPLLAELSPDELELLRNVAPTDHEVWKKMADKTRHNQKVCLQASAN